MHCQAEQVESILGHFLPGGVDVEGGRLGVAYLVVLACVLKATTKKKGQLFKGKLHPHQRKSWLRLCTEHGHHVTVFDVLRNLTGV